MKSLLPYVGILRLYSLIDFVLLLLTFNLMGRDLYGAIILWIGFLFLLEVNHKHEYRGQVSLFFALFLLGLGLIVYSNLLGGMAFVLLSYLYCKKNKGYWGVASPFIRALQPIVLISGISYSPYIWLVGILTFLRNLLGDLRDVKKDTKEGLKTFPVILGIKSGIKYVHLIAVMSTTAAWWVIGDFNLGVLIIAWVAEAITYNLTPRNLE